MIIRVHVTPAAKHDKIVRQEDGQYRAWVKALPVRGQANMALVAMLAQEFKVPGNAVRIINGYTSRHKTISIEESTAQP
ncbi:MAG TPA: DUF167 domain-containing protein [bacterium]|jgi:uncharacterized protein (TIGR00251 family)|nr:DUF167 domain-containing protein [bacterium]HOR57450.1 DUF167 domain-containing protein [bacterium]HPL56415.1 DUF167 domain-containing protein [bacterium]HPM27833.1 DUF167 domain-containing protein [bacterium]